MAWPLLLAVPSQSGGQESGSAAPAQVLACHGETIAAITIRTVRPADLARAERLGAVGAIRGFMHRATSWDVIRSFLYVHEGRPCSEFDRRESERVLRAQPFLAAASIRVVPAGRDSVQLEVATEDELPLSLHARIRHGTLSRVRLGNTNLFGQARSLTFQVENGFAYRTGFGVRYADYELRDRPLVLNLEALRDPLGESWLAAVREPFYTSLHPHSWYFGALGRRDYQRLRRPDGDAVSVQTDRVQWLAGTAWRLGRPQRAVSIGPLAAGERSRGNGAPVIVTDDSIVAFPGSVGRYDLAFTSVRAGLLLGVRRVAFQEVHGFDALSAAQDISSGFDVTLLAANSLPATRGIERDLLVGGSVYAGLARPTQLLALQVVGESRQFHERRGWHGTYVDGRVAWYQKPSPARTHVVSAEFSGAWAPRFPMQVTLADHVSGMRGFRRAEVGGGQRVIVRAERRQLIPSSWRDLELGAAAFVEGGKLWSGDAPFGVTTPWQGSVGLSLLGATPRGSKRTIRLDLAVTMTDAGRPARVELRAVTRDFTRMFWREPSEISRVREGALLGRVLGIPE